MGSKLHNGNPARENTDSNKTGMALGWVGVRTDVHRRQQAQLTVYRKKCQQAKIYKFDPAAAKKKKTAAAATEKKKKQQQQLRRRKQQQQQQWTQHQMCFA